VLWIGASLLGLVAVLLCVTVILLPVGIPLLRLAGRSYGTATRLMLPRAVAHPVKESKRGFRKKGDDAKDAVPDVSPGKLSKGPKKVKEKVAKKTKKKKGFFG
jgi:hypothetical protein